MDNQLEGCSLKELGDAGTFLLARPSRNYSSDDGKRLLLVPLPTSKDVPVFIEASRLLQDGKIRVILDIDETLISAYIYNDLKTAAAEAATASEAALAAQAQLTKGSQEWLEWQREFHLHNTIRARAKYWLKCMKAFRDGGSKACHVPGCRLAEDFQHVHCGEQDGLDTYIVSTNNQNLAESVTLVVIRPGIPALLETLQQHTPVDHAVETSTGRVPHPVKKSVSVIYHEAAAAAPPPASAPAPVAGASPAAAGPAGSSHAAPPASLAVTAPGAAEGTAGVTQAMGPVMPRPASRPLTVVLDNKSRAWMLQDRPCIYECPDFVALEAQAVSYLTQSAKYGSHTIPPEVLDRVEHSNAAAALFDRQLKFIESTMGDAKQDQRVRIKAFLKHPMADDVSLQQIRAVLGVPPTMAKALHDFAAVAVQQQLLEEEEEAEQQQQQQQHAHLDEQHELQELECPEEPSWKAKRSQALQEGDFAMYQASCEEEEEMKAAAAAQLAASAQRHAAAGLAGSMNRPHTGRKATSKDSDLQQTEGFASPLMSNAGGQAYPLPSVDGDAADPELQAPQRLPKRQKACPDAPCEDGVPHTAAAAAASPPPPPQQQRSAWTAATAAVPEMQQATAAPGAAARAEADSASEAAAAGHTAGTSRFCEVNVSCSSAVPAAGGSPTGQQLQQTGNATRSVDHLKGWGHYQQQRSGSYNSDNGNPTGQHSLQPRHASHAAGLQQQWSPQELARQQQQEAQLHQYRMQEEYRERLQQEQELVRAEARNTAQQQQQQQQQHPGATSAPAPDSSKQSSSPPGELPTMPNRQQLQSQYHVQLRSCGLTDVPPEHVAVWGPGGKYVRAKYFKDTIAWGGGRTVQEAESDAAEKAVLALQERILLPAPVGQAWSSHSPPKSDLKHSPQGTAASTPPASRHDGYQASATPRLQHLPKDNTPKGTSTTLDGQPHTHTAAHWSSLRHLPLGNWTQQSTSKTTRAAPATSRDLLAASGSPLLLWLVQAPNSSSRCGRSAEAGLDDSHQGL